MKREALVVYDGLPIASGGAHHLGRQSLTATRSCLESFLLDCTDRGQPDGVQLILYESTSVPSSFSTTIKERVTPVYGLPKRRQAVTGKNGSLWTNTWTIAPAQLSAAADWLATQLPLPRIHCVAGEPLVLGVEATFKLRDPRSGDVLPFQGTEHYSGQKYGGGVPLGLSRLYSRLSDRSTWALCLSLPFTQVSEELRTYLVALRDYLPFRLSATHWTRWQLNAEGTRYYPRKVKVV
jgi:hypothetical protein